MGVQRSDSIAKFLKRRVLPAFLILFGFLALREFLITRRWNAYLREMDGLRGAVQVSDVRRLSRAEALTPGNAWDDYLAAIKSEPVLGTHEPAIQRAWGPYEKSGDREAAERILTKAEDCLQRVRVGTTRESCHIDVIDEAFWNGKEVQRFILLSQILACRLRKQLEEGDGGLFPTLMMAIQLSHDLNRGANATAYFVGLKMLDEILGPACAVLKSRKLNSGELKELQEVLTLVDLGTPSLSIHADAELRERSQFIRRLAEELEFPSGRFRKKTFSESQLRSTPPWWKLWRNGFSTRLAGIETLELGRELDSRLKRLEEIPWDAFQAHEREARSHLSSKDRDYLSPPWTLVLSERGLRRTRAHLRLTMALLQVQRGQAPGDPDWPMDPFSRKPVRWRDMDNLRVLWCEGIDGDQGGVGDWDHYMYSEDILITVEMER